LFIISLSREKQRTPVAHNHTKSASTHTYTTSHPPGSNTHSCLPSHDKELQNARCATSVASISARAWGYNHPGLSLHSIAQPLYTMVVSYHTQRAMSLRRPSVCHAPGTISPQMVFFFWFSLEAELIQQTCRTLGHAPGPFFLVLPEGPPRHCWNRDEKLDLLVQ
jgi:hypothetical protein